MLSGAQSKHLYRFVVSVSNYYPVEMLRLRCAALSMTNDKNDCLVSLPAHPSFPDYFNS
jgi:hypothetical protein